MPESQIPLVSVIIPVYNRENLVGETLDSVIAQTYQNWECIVVDDGSADRTREVVQSYCDKDQRIKLFNRPTDRPKGANACRNYGLELSLGEFIKWFDSDDLMKELLIQSQLEFLKRHWEYNVAICDWESFGVNSFEPFDGFPLPRTRNPDKPLEEYVKGDFYFQTGAGLWQKEYLNKVGIIFDERLERGQEAEFHFQHIIAGVNFYWHHSVLFSIRRGHPRIGSEYGKTVKSETSFLLYWEIVCNGLTAKKVDDDLILFALKKRLYGLRRIRKFGFSLDYISSILEYVART